MASLGSLVIELGANTARLSSDMGKAVGIVERGAQRMQGALKVFGASLVGGALLGVIRQSAAFGDELSKAAVKAGVSGKAISELAYAGKLADIELSSLSTALKKMQVELSKVGSGGSSQALDALGLSFNEIRALAPDQQFELIADRISQLKNPADRTRAAVELFGKAGSDLLPLFEQGAAGIRSAREEAERLGQSFSTEQLKAIEAANDSVTKLTSSFSAMATALLSKVAPGLTQFFNNITAIATGDRLGKLREQIDFLERMQGRSFLAAGYQDIGTGFFTAAEGAAKLVELRAKLEAMERRSAAAPAAAASGKAKGYSGSDSGKAMARDLDVVVTSRRVAVTAMEQLYRDLEEQTRTSVQRQVAEFEQLSASVNELVAAGRMSQTEAAKRTTAALDEILTGVEVTSRRVKVQTEALSEFAIQAARNMQTAFADFLFDPFQDGLKGMLKGFVDVMRRIVAERAVANIFDSKDKGGLGFGDIVSSFVDGLFGGKRAAGGPVSAGKAYLVGERGPELFAPGASGSIIPNGKMGGGIVINQSIDARGATADLVQALPAILAENNRRMYDELDRRYGIR